MQISLQVMLIFFSGSYEFKFIGAWIGLLSYTFQIYFDFSAYSEMAIGLGKMFGFEFPINFNSPYKAKSFSDFWNRWHITLSRFLRDYLYIPLGGNRNGNVKTYVNLSLTMLIGGLWHGASWLFVIWGALHGLYLTLERLISRERLESIFGYRIIVFIAVCIAWIFFRSENLDFALKVLESCFLMNGIESMESSYTVMSFGIPEFVRTYGGFAVLAAISGTLILVNFFPNAAQIKSRTGYLYLFCMTLILVYCLLHVDKPSPFYISNSEN
ncbi:MAG: MBOAT family protein [Crocinitomicaceae bacterium]|nr:MBOAT family protein [Crocinitomicaceae bacterium]